MNILNKIAVFTLSILLTAIPLFAREPIVVSSDGKGDFKTIGAAINSLPADTKEQRIILIKKGIYGEKIFIDKNFITLKGEDPNNTIITISLARDEWRCNNMDDYGTAAINLKGNDIRLENLTFINSYGKDAKAEKNIPCAKDSTGSKMISPSAHQMALRSFATTRLIVVNCIFRAWGGDTVSPWNTEDGMFYFKDCTMEGGVDFYCPRGWALADNCTFICQSSPAAIWHDGSKYESSKTVLLNCKFSGDDNFNLGRYHRDAQFYLLNCTFANNMADKDIYLVPTNNKILWGRRVYYYNCHRAAGDFAWYKNNLPADFGINEFNVPWVYDYKWNPAVNKNVPAVELNTIANAVNGTEDGVANNMLLYQRSNGGWPKHFMEQKVDYNKKLNEEELKILKSGYAEGIDATIDNEATTKEIKYLVKAYKNTTNINYLQAAEKGIAYLLKAQYKNGGWPQYYPDFSSYRSEITYNDNAMVNVLNVLEDIVNKTNGMDVINSTYIIQSRDAINRGIDCILKTQVMQKGKLTAWCAQYDASTLKPAKARKYELPSLSGSESVGILRFLMTVENPSKEIINAMNAGVDWLNKVKIVGYRFITVDAPGTPKGKDKILAPDPGSTTWARFYDLETDEPFFCGRDGIPKKTVAEVEYERRTGYAWYGDWPAKLLTLEYPKWRAKWN
jgi:PelA/Pel-15E family pectate lyase